MNKRFGLVLALILVAALGAPGSAQLVAAAKPSSPTVWYVIEGGAGARDGSSWENAFATIQAAVNATRPGDTIMVGAGKYDAFLMQGKANISIVGAKGATVTTTNLYIDLPVVQKAWVMAAVYESQNINIKGLNFDGTAVKGPEKFVGIAYVDSTGRIADLTVQNVIATSLGAGVAIIGYSGTAAVWITDTTISNNNAGIYVHGGSTLEAHFSNIFGNSEYGLYNAEGGIVDATYNWWGHASGPLHQTNPLGKGNAVVGNVDFRPWLGAAPAIVKTQTVAATTDSPLTVDAKAEADTEVVVGGTATVTIAKLVLTSTAASTLAKYASNREITTSHDSVGHTAPPSQGLAALSDELKPLNMFRDIRVTDATPGTEIEIRLYYTDAQARDFDETTLRLFWHNGSDWVQSSHTGVNTTDITDGNRRYSGYMWAKVTATTTPSLADLGGTPWGGYGHPAEPRLCVIATAVYGTDTAKEIDLLREFRDAVLLPTSLGAHFVSLYYRASPPLAALIYRNEVLKAIVRVGFVAPVVTVLSWTHRLWSATVS